MSPKTKEIMEAMVDHARNGHDVIPMYFQPHFGRSNSVSAAIRAAKKLNLLVENGVDGMGKPKYKAVMPNPTHNVTNQVN